MTDALREQFDHYIGTLVTPEDDALRWIQQNAQHNNLPTISVQPVEGYLLGWLVRLVNAKKAVEIGTLAGYSGTWIARALPDDGKLITVEVSSKHADVARAGFERAGVESKVEIMQGAALEVLHKISPRGPFDFVFIDADKVSYPDYLAWSVENVRPGGLITAHNIYRHGQVLNPQDDGDRMIKAFAEQMAADARLDMMVLPLGDALAVARRK
ncbi:MAG: O-methyltransferase [bacterium]|nr:O-methyltransferase [bacterium]